MAKIKYYDNNKKTWKYANDDSGKYYKLPVASENKLGGVTAPLPTSDQTEFAAIDEAGRIKTNPKVLIQETEPQNQNVIWINPNDNSDDPSELNMIDLESSAKKSADNARETLNTMNLKLQDFDTKVNTTNHDFNAKLNQAKTFSERKVIVDSQTEPTDKGAIWLNEIPDTNPEAPDYNAFINKPRINGKELMGNLSLDTLEDDWELIETITINKIEESIPIVKSEEPNGQRYNFKAMTVKIHTGSGEGGNIGLCTIFNDIGHSVASLFHLNKKGVYEAFSAEKSHGYWKDRKYQAKENDTLYNDINTGQDRFLTRKANDNNCNKVNIVAMPVGTVIEIWGVRA